MIYNNGLLYIYIVLINSILVSVLHPIKLKIFLFEVCLKVLKSLLVNKKMSNEIRDLTDFDKSIVGMFNLLKNVIKSHERNNLNLSSTRNPIMTRLERYIKAYDATEPEDHVWYFGNLYKNHRGAILRGPARDGWLRSNNITIHFGEEVGRPIRNTQIHLSAIYNTACKLREDTEQNMVGLPSVGQSQELVYPPLIQLFLYKIFHEVINDESEKDKLSEHIIELEQEVGINKKNKKSAKKGDNSDDPLGGILNAATGMMEQMGIKLPEGQKLPSGNDLTGALNGVLQNPQTKSMLGNVLKEVQGCNSIGEVASKLMGQMGSLGMDPATQDMIKDNLNRAIPNSTTSNEAEEYGSGEDEFLDGDEFLDE